MQARLARKRLGCRQARVAVLQRAGRAPQLRLSLRSVAARSQRLKITPVLMSRAHAGTCVTTLRMTKNLFVRKITSCQEY